MPVSVKNIFAGRKAQAAVQEPAPQRGAELCAAGEDDTEMGPKTEEAEKPSEHDGE